MESGDTGSAELSCSATATGPGRLNVLLSVVYSNNVVVGTAGASATYSGDANYSGSSESTTFATSATVQDFKRAALLALAGIVPTGSKDTDKRINDAIDSITTSLARPNWTDQNHIDGKRADKIFNDEKSAVRSLMDIKGTAPAGAASAISELISADKLLAQTAIAESASAKNIAEANKEMAKAQDDISKGHFDTAIDHFKNAWKQG